jgi:hypothetical protein
MIHIQTQKTNMRHAFSMITAIFLIVLMSTVAVFVMDISGKVVKETTAQYRKEQAILYAKSYTEFAIMALTAQNCVQTITADVDGSQNEVKAGQGYRVIVNIQYLGNDNGCPNTIGGNVTTSSSRGNVILVDTYVHYRDPEHPNAQNAIAWALDPGITYHRRTLQKL